MDLKKEAFLRYRTASIINIIVCALQLVIFFFAQSISLFADATHSIADGVILLGSTFVSYKAMILPQINHEHIKRRMTRIAVILLWVSAPFIVWTSWGRIHSPVSFPGVPVVLAAIVSVLGNIMMHRIVHGINADGHDYLVKANLVHILGDGILSVGVLLSALLVVLFNTAQYDGYIGLACACWMCFMGVGIWKQTSRSNASMVSSVHAIKPFCDHRH